MATSGISVMDFAANLSMVNARLAPAIAPYFEDLGVSVTQFSIASVTLPDEVNEYYDKVTGMNMIGDMDKFQRFNTALATGDARTAAGAGAQDGMAMGLLFSEMAATQQQTQQAAPAPAATPAAANPMEKLTTLKQMFDADLITEQEYAAKKAAILEEM